MKKAAALILALVLAVLCAVSCGKKDRDNEDDESISSQLEKSRENTDIANIRSTYAEVVAEALTRDCAVSKTVSKITQTKPGWIIDDPVITTYLNGEKQKIFVPDMKSGDTVTVTVDTDGTISITVN